jgi:trehalose 6-phosphate synthase
MNIVSYRGPGEAGGVSTALAGIFEEHNGAGSWWHMKDAALQIACDVESEAKTLINLSTELVKGHYRFCNEFLWPVLHDMPEYAALREGDREHYQRFNEVLSRMIAHSSEAKMDSTFFVQDYQLALMPQYLKRFGAHSSTVFWHVPWPRDIQDEHAIALVPLAKGMLSADVIGFHVNEYGENFLRFVESYLPEFHCDFARMRITPAEEAVPVFVPSSNYSRIGTRLAMRSTRSTEIIIAPLGIDADHWSAMAQNARATLWQPWLTKKPYVLSVDRADYTKGITSRLQAIDAFFEKYPEWRGEIAFAQICGRTRAGIPAYDNYWQECRALEAKLKEKWDMGHWQPLIWLDRLFSPPQLSLLYRNAAIMLVNPIRDGLNLTAKEYVACQGSRPGSLALSPGAGAWQELGESCLEVRPEEPGQMADAVYQALNMPQHEKALKMESLSRKVARNTLQKWWQRFSKPIDVKRAAGKGFSQLREIS